MDRLKSWTDKNIMRFDKCRVLHLGRNNSIQAVRSLPAGKELSRVRPGCPGGHESAVYSYSQEGQWLPGLH